jgi:hypothetical protein
MAIPAEWSSLGKSWLREADALAKSLKEIDTAQRQLRGIRTGLSAVEGLGLDMRAKVEQALNGNIARLEQKSAAVARAVSGIRVSAAADKGHDRHLTRPA